MPYMYGFESVACWTYLLIIFAEQKCIEVPTHQNVFITHQIIEPTT